MTYLPVQRIKYTKLTAISSARGGGIALALSFQWTVPLFPSGEENTYATMLVTMLGLGAQMERSLIMGRLNSGRKHAMENGVVMGRKPGSVKTREQKEAEYKDVSTFEKEIPTLSLFEDSVEKARIKFEDFVILGH